MPKLSDLIILTPKSTSVDKPCQANPQHLSRRYVEVVVKSPNIYEAGWATEVKDILPENRLTLDVCQNCLIEFMGYAAAKLEELGTL